MKTVTPEQLAKAYTELYPDELVSPNNTPEQCLEQVTRTLGNWLDDYSKDPAKKVRGANWYGKVTTALFRALNIKQPKTVKAMLEALS
jgi:hypothetical protein